ncbi:hypothetical protein RSAG8_07897, partial [Rhizoctonia solani AG-8 WAC10335]
MSGAASTSTSSSPFIPVDPSLISIPQPSSDPAIVIQCLNELKDALVSINHNLATAIDGIKNNKAEIDREAHDVTLLNNANSSIMADLTTFQGALNGVITTVAALGGTGSASTSTGAAASAAPRKPKLQEPAKFDGTDKNKAVAFRIAYIQSCLEGKASEWLDPYQEQDVVIGTLVPWLHNVTDFWTEFNSRWNVQNKKENNRGKLHQLTQTKSVQEYHKDFQTYSQGIGYNDTSLRDMFYDGLAIKIKETMVLQDYDHTMVTFPELAARAMLIESRLDAFKVQNKTAPNGAPDVLKSTKTKDAKQWMMKVVVWASFSTNRFTSEREMVKYLLTLMEGEAGDWALPHLAKLAGGDPRAEIYNMISFGREFALAFDDPDAERAAARKITELTQTGNTAEYTTLFHTYAAELSWNDTALHAQYSRGLHFKVKEVLSQREVEPATLRDLINAANKIDQTHHENEESRPNRDKKDKDKGKGKTSTSQSKSDKKEDGKYGDNYGHSMKECHMCWKPPKTKEEKETKVKKESAKAAKDEEEEEDKKAESGKE